jgi:hypothetical protein
MELVVRLSRATHTSIMEYLKLPLKSLYDWANVTNNVIISDENNHG